MRDEVKMTLVIVALDCFRSSRSLMMPCECFECVRELMLCVAFLAIELHFYYA